MTSKPPAHGNSSGLRERSSLQLLDFLQKTKKDHGGGISRAPSGQYARILARKKIFVKFSDKCEKSFSHLSETLLHKITRGDFPQSPFGENHTECFPAELLSFFISFLSRERKETKQRKETAARAKFACTPGAPPLGLKCLRRRGRETFDEL